MSACEQVKKELTRNVFLENIVVFEHSTKQALRVVVDNHDLPSSGRVYGADGVEKACGSVSKSAAWGVASYICALGQ
jgi:hypothetical protein